MNKINFVSAPVVSEFVCDYCGGVFSLPAYDPLFGKGQVCFRCHMEANNNIESMANNVTSKTKLEDTRMVLEVTKAELEGIKAELDTYDNERDYCNGWTMREVQEDLMRDTMTELVKVIEELEEEIEMAQELDRFAEELEEDYEDELEAGRIRDEQRNDDVLKAPSDIELALDREQTEDVDDDRFHAGENYIDECHACGFVFEVQDLIPVDRHGGVVYFCEKCFEEEYHAGM